MQQTTQQASELAVFELGRKHRLRMGMGIAKYIHPCLASFIMMNVRRGFVGRGGPGVEGVEGVRRGRRGFRTTHVALRLFSSSTKCLAERLTTLKGPS